MRITILFILLSFSAFGQDYYFGRGQQDTVVTIVKYKAWEVTPTDGLTIKFPVPHIDSAITFIAPEGKRFIVTATFKEIVGFDSTVQIIESTDVLAVKTNMTSVTGSTKPGISGQSFIFVTNTNITGSLEYSFSIENTGAMEFWSERYAGHGKIVFLINGVPAATFDQGAAEMINGQPVYRTDLQRGRPTFRTTLKKGTYTVKVQQQTLPAQYTLDFLKVIRFTPK